MQEIHTMMYIDNEVLEKMIMTIVEGFDRIEETGQDGTCERVLEQ